MDPDDGRDKDGVRVEQYQLREQKPQDSVKTSPERMMAVV